MRIYFDSTMVNDFMSYAMQRKSEIERDYEMLPYFTTDKVKIIAKYYAKRKLLACDDNGNEFYSGEQTSWTCSSNWGEGQRLLRENKMLFIENCLFHPLWCRVEKLLRMEHQGQIDKDDESFLNNAKKFISEN